MHWSLKIASTAFFAGTLILLTTVNSLSQTPISAPKGRVNDFAGVLDASFKEHLETTLENLKQRSKIDFYLATVPDTGGQDIFDYSRQLAHDWNIGARTSAAKSLLLVISVASKTSFTQFSRSVQDDLPDGVLGEMSQRMRTSLVAAQFADAVNAGLQLFVSSMAQKIGFSTQDIDKPSTTAADGASPTSGEPNVQMSTVALAESTKTRPRVVNEAPKASITEVPKAAAADTPKRTTMKGTPATRPTATAVKKAAPKPDALIRPSTTPVDDEAEAEEVELTLTLPLPKRAIKLKEFLEAHPASKARTRATELLISTHAALGDQQLKNGDLAGGVEQLLQAIDESDMNITDQLFSGVISQIPMNLYMRGEHAAAFKAAQSVESKFGTDPKRLLAVANFYLGIERGDEAARIAQQVATLSPDMAGAHYALGVSYHITLRLDEAAAEYKRALELDANLKNARTSLADLSRAGGKAENALALYNEQLKTDPKDKAARTGMVMALYELGRADEANSALDAALAEQDPRNLILLTGAAYWFAAHNNNDRAFELARKAVAMEPRYTWAQIAYARSLLGLKRPLEAERSLRFAKQYGKFPTLDYELANVLASMGLYEEAAEVLRGSFTLRNGDIETRLAGRLPAKAPGFLELLGPERRASIFQNSPADSESNAAMLKSLLSFRSALDLPADGSKLDEGPAVAAAKEFASGSDNMRAYRQIFAASRLLRNGVGIQTAYDLAEESRKSTDAALDVVSPTMAVQADEFRELRARAMAAGNVPDVEAAPRSVLSNILRGRIDDLSGWALFNQDKYPEAIEHLKRAASTLPEGTPSWRTASWHLGVAFEQNGNKTEALESYVKSYNSGEKDPVRRRAIEQLYRKINGSLDGLDDRIGPSISDGASTGEAPSTDSVNKQPIPDSAANPIAPTADKTTGQQKTASGNPVRDEATVATPLPIPDAAAAPTPAPTPAEPVRTEPNPTTDESLKTAAARLRTNVKLEGRVLEANQNGIANVVVVLISPSGSVLASTTDKSGNYSFTVIPSQKTYRIIPSKDGYIFAPVDKTLVGFMDDVKDIDFIGSARSP